MRSPAARHIATTSRFLLLVRSGPDKGASFSLAPPKVTIGRDRENLIALNDPRVSRAHAVIEFRTDRIVLIDQSSRGSTVVNGSHVSEAVLNDGDQITFGETELVFRIEQPQPQFQPQPQPQFQPQPQPHLQPPSPRSLGQPGPPPRQRKQKRSTAGRGDNGKLRFYIIVLGIGGVFAWLVSSGPKPPEKDPTLRTSAEIEAEILGSEERQAMLTKKREFKSEAERIRYEEAQSHYLQGFRDYQKGNYSRAMRAFETARAIDPNHQMAARYYSMAVRRRDEFIDRHIRNARKYKEKIMYARCVSSLDKALKTMAEFAGAKDLKLKEAKALRGECEALMKERF